MWAYEKKLEYPIHIAHPNPTAAKIIMSQLGGPHGNRQ
ncbi:MAG: manganese catalase family protein [Massiliimalia sp.]